MRVTFPQLEAFYWICRLGTFQAAAQHLHLSQPTVSIRIRQLQSALGKTLLERAGRQVHPTAAGSALFAHAEQALGLALQIEKVGSTRAPARVLMRVGAPETFAMACLADLTSLLVREHTELKLEVTIANSAELTALLHARKLDLAFITDPDFDRRLRAEPLGGHEMLWVAAPQFDLPEIVRPADILPHQIICNPHPSVMFRLMMQWFRSAGAELPRMHTCTSLTVMARLAASGVGVTLLPPSIVAAELAAGALRTHAARPRIPGVNMFAVFHEENASTRAVIGATRKVLARKRFLLPQRQLRRAG
jgi:DNA-binding transcriptional LysR family regulator